MSQYCVRLLIRYCVTFDPLIEVYSLSIFSIAAKIFTFVGILIRFANLTVLCEKESWHELKLYSEWTLPNDELNAMITVHLESFNLTNVYINFVFFSEKLAKKQFFFFLMKRESELMYTPCFQRAN